MKEEIARIMRLVQEGKLSPEDGAELIDAFAEQRPQEPPAQPGEPAPEPPKPPVQPTPPDAPEEPKDPFKSFVEMMENLGKDVSNSVNWKDVASQVRDGARKAVDAVKSSVEEIRARGGLFSSSTTREFTLPLNLTEGKAVRVESTSGDIKVVGGQTEGKVVATARVSGSDDEDAKTRADKIDVILEESDSAIVVRAPDAPGVSVDLVIFLPVKAATDIRSVSGDIVVEGTQAGCRATATSGDIKVKGLDGQVELRSTSGDILVENCTASDLDLESKSGDILVRASSGTANVRAASGDVRLAGFTGKTVSVEAVTGDVSVDFVEPITGTVSVRTVNGEARVSVPDGCDCRVTLSTLRGEVRSDLQLQDENRQEQRLSGRLGDGVGSLDVSAVNGGIALRQRFVAPTD